MSVEARPAQVRFRAVGEGVVSPSRPSADGQLVRASLNESPFPPMPGVAEAIAAEIPHLGRYGGDMAGATAAIAAAYGRRTDEVLISAGSGALIQAITAAICGLGDEVLLSWLSFPGYLTSAQMNEATPVKVPWADDGGHDVTAILGAITDQTRMIMLSSPNNPSGTSLRREQYEELVAGTPPDVLICLDEAYADFATSPDAFIGAAHPDLPENVVVLKTFSKAIGLAGLRMGFMLAAPRIIEGVARMRSAAAVSRLGLAVATYCYSPAGQAEVRQRLTYLITERERIRTELLAAGVPVPDSDASFVWLPVGDGTAELTARIADAGIIARPFDGQGVRYTVWLSEVNDRFIAAVTDWWRRDSR
ncbi:putative phenylalanine aminotransferase [Microlunatus endophyticus]|uniref:Phenylalanine aminotransferase n=1 Tax=Microlunatus endophyticus TaxID=1716077 RepID=A0A917SFG3_9ACTN|nr:aminotransferase class I/II-fold pyridoxal phosphate-dependent enzyme [Microlunatus endophyticus]GGL76871.1 putative phenylalanine aminotransferase [Microlunatus endophyticus]